MPVYDYEALDSSGKKIRGIIEADSSRGARQKLKSTGVFPTSLTEGKVRRSKKTWNIQVSFRNRRVNVSTLAMFTRQLATLIGAGMPVVEAFGALGEQIELPLLKEVVGEVRSQVNEGATLAEAMQKHPDVFPRLYTNMIAAGESSGTLEAVLERLADLYEAQAMLRRKVQSALFYPILMLVLCVAAIILLLAYVVPEITALFEDHGTALPFATQVVIALSDIVQGYWWLGLVVISMIVIVFTRYKKTEQGKETLDRIILGLPVLGTLTRKVATSRFSRSLGSMLTGGVTLLNALAIARNLTGNIILEQAVDNAIEGVREGRNLAEELRKTELFPPLLIHMTAVGEKTGSLESMLLKAATTYESEVDSFVTGLTSTLEPVLILTLAIIVGGILFSVMMPMLEMSSFAT